MGQVIITAEIHETNPYRGTSSNPVEYTATIIIKGMLGDVTHIKDKLLQVKL